MRTNECTSYENDREPSQLNTRTRNALWAACTLYESCARRVGHLLRALVDLHVLMIATREEDRTRLLEHGGEEKHKYFDGMRPTIRDVAIE